MVTSNKNKLQKFFHNMIEQIQKRIPLKAIILFGSRARGDARLNSDYNLVIIADFQEKYLARSEWILEYAPFVSLDLFCYTPQEFENLFSSYNITAIDSIGEGVVLFGSEYLQPYRERYENFISRGLKKYKCILFPPTL